MNNIGLIKQIRGDLDSALDNFNSALDLNKHLNDTKGIAVQLSNIGLLKHIRGDLDSALDNFNLALNIFKNLYDLKNEGTLMNNIGSVLADRGDFEGAMKHYIESLKISERLADFKGKASTLGNIGQIFLIKRELDEALKYSKEALEISKQQGDLTGISTKLNNIGKILYSKGDWHEALDYYKQSLEIDEKLGYLSGIAADLGNIGHVLEKKGKLKKAMEYQKRMLKISEDLGDLFGKSTALENIGFLFHHQGDYNLALGYFKKSFDLLQIYIKGKEIDFKFGKISCPNPNCQKSINFKFVADITAFLVTCQKCGTQFSLWITDPAASKCIVSIPPKNPLKIGDSIVKDIQIQNIAGSETQTKISEWLHSGALTAENIGHCFKEIGNNSDACEYYLQSAMMYRALNFIMDSEENLKKLEILLPKISIDARKKFLHNIEQLRKTTSESLRSRDFSYLFVLCPICLTQNQIQAGETTVSVELCSNCLTKFSVFYNEETREFYTNIIKESKLKVFSREDRIETAHARFCVRCGLAIGIKVNYCPRCGLQVIRENYLS